MFEATNRHFGPSCTSCSSTQPCWARATARHRRSAPARAGMGTGDIYAKPKLGWGSHCLLLPRWQLSILRDPSLREHPYSQLPGGHMQT